MANIHRGEVNLTSSNKNFVLRLTINSLCEFESVVQMDATQAIEQFLEASRVGSIKLRIVRALLWAALLEKHQMTLDDAGKLIDEVGLKDILDAIGNAIIAAFPKEEKSSSTENPT